MPPGSGTTPAAPSTPAKYARLASRRESARPTSADRRSTADILGNPGKTLTKPQLLGILAGKGLDGVQTDGDPGLLKRLFSYVTAPERAFPIVTP